MLVAVYIVQVARLLAQDHAVKTLVHKAIVVLDQLPYQLGRHDDLNRTREGNALAKESFDWPPEYYSRTGDEPFSDKSSSASPLLLHSHLSSKVSVRP